MKPPPIPAYPLGHSHRELDRLVAQGRNLAPHTSLVFTRAGLAPGQRVLDVGCGVGEVSFITSQFVGETGHVLGIDRSPEAIATARERARDSGHRNVAFSVGDVADLQVTGRFDAIVGRIVLMYLEDPVAALKRLRTLLSRQGMMIFQEGDIATIGSEPECPLITRLRNLFLEAFARSGAATNMGSRLCDVMHRAGLVPEGSWVSQPSHVGPHLAHLEWFAELTRTLLPAIERHGLATAEELDLPTLTARLQHEAIERNAVVYKPRLTGVWGRARR